ncbi:MAG: hypothetical protein HOO67_01875 [Candidatus Peribacteraceae bacterium]|nr:hypothetical protein [Candidatus Peribacteraceae bacterium]
MKLTVTVIGDTAFYLKKAAQRDKIALEKKASKLLKLGLETEEDMILARRISEPRDTKDAKFISHEEFWARLKVRASKNKISD